jgi:hypothetical protein
VGFCAFILKSLTFHIPVRMVAVDPLSTKGDRDHLKRRRDMEQAEAAAHIAVKYLQLPFDDRVLSAFPKQLRAQADGLLQ